eukprot:TRINITY_DN448_c2_g1_i2.p1 TRINITY_DN448_c2_g1~~TRINITY_DN448_c2_g1_i2.p1  ORF type:complete len:471 (-),score=101.38 TRINITY_DN448_c2_g1_i2:540-1952(-)
MLQLRLFAREIGEWTPHHFQQSIIDERTMSLELNPNLEIMNGHSSPITCLDIDLAELKYLLSSGLDSRVSLFDLTEGEELTKRTIKPIFTLDNAHEFCVSAVQWYPVDTGTFFTASYDKTVKVWDTNSLQIYSKFTFAEKVYSIAMSPIATTHSFLAVATKEQSLRLCDLRSGSTSHSLFGHREAIFTTRWSPFNEFELVTGGQDGTLRQWDVRTSASCLLCFDQHLSNFAVQSQQNLPTPTPTPYFSSTQLPSFSSSSSSSSAASVSPSPSRGRALPQRGRGSGTRRGAIRTTTPSRALPNNFTPQKRHLAVATAHDGSVLDASYTPDGRFLVSLGSDKKLRLWNTHTGANQLVNYGMLSSSRRSSVMTSKKISISRNGKVVFVPCGTVLRSYHLLTGEEAMPPFTGHYEPINCSIFHPANEMLFTAASDKQILVWTPKSRSSQKEPEKIEDEDKWSDEEPDSTGVMNI